MNVYLLGALLVVVAVMSTPALAGATPEVVCGLAGNSCQQTMCCTGLTCIHDPLTGISTCQNASPPPPCVDLQQDCNTIPCCPTFSCIHDPNTTPLDRCEANL